MNVNTMCPVCGLEYVTGLSEETKKHKAYHQKFLNACKQFGPIWPRGECERVKRRTCLIFQDKIHNYGKNYSLEEKYHAAILYLRAYYCRSFVAAKFDINHPAPYEYMAMLLNQKNFKDRFDPDVLELLLQDIGTAPGIKEGETYYSTGYQRLHKTAQKAGS